MADGNQNYEIAERQDQAVPERGRDLTAYLPEDASIVERAVFAGMPLDMIDRLRTMAKEERQEKAKLAFFADKVAAKAEMPPVRRNRTNSHTRSTYADLAAIDVAITPIITKHGFTTEATATTSSIPGHIAVTFKTIHNQGHSEEFTLDWALDGEGMKGNSNKTPVQALKSTLTFARRVMKMMAFDIADTDDDDGNAPPPKRETLSDEQIAVIEDLLTRSGTDRQVFLQYAKVSEVPDIITKNFDRLKKILEGKLEQKK